MVRVKRGNVAIKRRKKIFKFAKGYTGAHSRLFRTANQQVMKALVYSYVGRKRRKRDFRSLWICRVNAASRSYGLTYSRLKNLLKNKKPVVNFCYYIIDVSFKIGKSVHDDAEHPGMRDGLLGVSI